MLRLIYFTFCLTLALAGKVTKLPNGNYAITGKGCGISTPLRYMSVIPENPEAFECIIIQNSEKVTKHLGNDCKHQKCHNFKASFLNCNFLDIIAEELGLQIETNTNDNEINDLPPSNGGGDSGQCADSASFCSTARGDGYCDDNCNYADCNFDDGDCCGDDVNTLVCDECLCKE